MSRSTPLSCLLVLTAVLTSCSGVTPPVTTTPPPQTGGELQSLAAITLSQIDGMQFGSAYDSTTGGFLGTTNCLVPTTAPVLASPGQLAQSFKMTKIESKSELASALDVGGKASYNTGVTSVSGSARFTQDQDTNSYSVGMIVKADATGETYKLYDTTRAGYVAPKLTDTFQALYDTNYQAFKESCGDYFLNDLTLGGTYGAFFNFTSYSQEQRQSIEASLSAQSGPFSVSADFSKKMHSLASTSTTTITTFQTGIPGIPSTNLDTLITDAEQFSNKLLTLCKGSEGLKSCIKTGSFNAYQNFFGPPNSKAPENKSVAAINKGSAYLNTLVIRAVMVDRLAGSKKVIDSNPTIYDAAVLSAARPALLKVDRWKLGFQAAIKACNDDITACMPSADGAGSDADAEATYGLLPTYDLLENTLLTLPDVSARLPGNCNDQQLFYKQTADKDYLMFLDQDITRSLKLFCKNMATGQTPVEYVSLGAQNNTQSVVDFTDSQKTTTFTGALLDGKQITTFTKIRIAPNTLIVDPTDTTYTQVTGSLTRNGAVTSTPSILGSAGQCRPEAEGVLATATIDLQFATLIFNTDTTSFTSAGFAQSTAGTAIPSENKKTYKITSGRGFCSDTVPVQIRLMLPPK